MRNKKILFLFFFLFVLLPFSEAQTEKASRKHKVFLYWGYNEAKFSNSTIHFSGPDYDFTLNDVKATDRPSKPGTTYIHPATFTVPQYNYRIGYFLTNRFALSVGMDHMKYVMVQDQTVKMDGWINSNASDKYNGTFDQKKIVLSSDFLRFEHTNGFNLFTLEGEWFLPIFQVGNFLALNLFGGIGIGPIVTKTDVHVLNYGMDNKFHLSGYSLALKAGPRVEFKNFLFLAAELKYGYANLPDVPIHTASPERAKHSLQYFEKYVVLGSYIGRCSKSKSPIIY